MFEHPCCITSVARIFLRHCRLTFSLSFHRYLTNDRSHPKPSLHSSLAKSGPKTVPRPSIPPTRNPQHFSRSCIQSAPSAAPLQPCPRDIQCICSEPALARPNRRDFLLLHPNHAHSFSSGLLCSKSKRGRIARQSRIPLRHRSECSQHALHRRILIGDSWSFAPPTRLINIEKSSAGSPGPFAQFSGHDNRQSKIDFHSGGNDGSQEYGLQAPSILHTR